MQEEKQSARKMGSGITSVTEEETALTALAVADSQSDPNDSTIVPALIPGDILAGRYRLGELLGKGAMGDVFRAEDLKLGQTVALKFIAKALAHDDEVRDRFLDEVRLARSITHSNICRVYDLGEAGGNLFLSMEFIEGETLSDVLLRGPLSEEKVTEIALQICHGLAAAHAQGIIHRDLKPANLLIDQTGRLRISDFGLAAFSESVQGLEARCGTPAYMAPEQHAGLEATVRSDLYALGILLYEMTTGSRPFQGSFLELLKAHRGKPVPPLASYGVEVGPNLEETLFHCLAKAPDDRPASAEAVAQALEHGLDLATGISLETLAVFQPSLDGVDHKALAGWTKKHGGHRVRLASDPERGDVWLFKRAWGAVGFALEVLSALEILSAEERFAAAIHLGEVELTAAESGTGRLVGGPSAQVPALLARLASPGQILLTGHAFDLARLGAAVESRARKLQWPAHGHFMLRELDQAVEVYEVGEMGKAPLHPPPDTADAWSVAHAETILGWRPAPGLDLPAREGWILERKLGEGGFGEVWLARGPARGADVDGGERRVFKFCYEASRRRSLEREVTLFRLLKEELGERDDIVRVLDWNFDEPPYFLEMGWSAVGDLEEWAASEGGLQRVPLEDRLEIVAQAATALAAAHSVGVLHKDVKPANLLIGRDAQGALHAQLTDFGIGALMEQDRLEAAGITVMAETRTGTTKRFEGTPLYMAPEVLEGRVASLQADIYALGVLLYQMIVGDFSRALAPGWERDVDDELLRQDLVATVDGSPTRRLGNALRLAERLRSLEERREQLSLQRTEEAEAARVRAALARSRQRRRWVAALFVAVLIFAGSMWHQSRQIEKEAESARQVSQFLIDLFEVADPDLALGETVTAREILDQGAQRIERELGDQPEIQARLMETIGVVYHKLGLDLEAMKLLEASLEIRREEYDEKHSEIASNLYALGMTKSQAGEYSEADVLLQEALELRIDLFGEGHTDVAKTLRILATNLERQGNYAGSKELLLRCIYLQDELYEGDHLEKANTLSQLALVLQLQSDYSSAEQRFNEALDMYRRVVGMEHRLVSSTLNNLAILLEVEGDIEGGEVKLRESLEINRRLLGERHHEVATNLLNLSGIMSHQGKLEEAEAASRQALEIYRESLGLKHPNVAAALNTLSVNLRDHGKFEEAEALFPEILEIMQEAFGDRHPNLGILLGNHARILVRLERLDFAEQRILAALEILESGLPADHWRIASAQAVQASIWARRGRFAEAEEQFLANIESMEEQLGRESHYTQEVIERLIDLYERWDRPDEAEKYRALLSST